MRRRMGEAARAMATDDAWRTRWHAVVSARLPSQQWPDRALLITAVDAGTGEPVVFDRSSGVELADAVAASCSSGAAYRIGDRAYIDGGYRSNAENADLAGGYARVLVLSPFGGRSLVPASWGLGFAGVLCLLGVLCSMATTRLRLLAAAIAGVVAVAAYAMPLKLNVVLAIGLAVLACFWLEQRMPKGREQAA